MTTDPQRVRGIWAELGGMLGLVALAVFLLRVSWRKWNHPLIDFGRELHLPWRLSEGAVLYRDVDDVYGPFSQYFNAGLFAFFGPGLVVLAVANLVIAFMIVALTYGTFRRAWGVPGAWTGCFLFLSVFAFNQSLYVANFNYVTPYAHEATHGVLVCLALVGFVGRWLERPTGGRIFFAGFCGGLTLVIKPEFILASAAVAGAAAFLHWRAGGRVSAGDWLRLGLGALLPTLGFFIYFALHFPLPAAAIASARAWASILIHSEMMSLNYQQIFLGIDQPWSNLLLLARRSLIALVSLVGLGYLLRRALGLVAWRRAAALGIVFATALTFGLFLRFDSIGSCLIVLLSLYLALNLGFLEHRRADGFAVDSAILRWRILLCVLAITLMARMILAGRIVQFGFFQAALATMVLGAILVSEGAEWLPQVRGQRLAAALLVAALVGPGIARKVAVSQGLQRLQTFSVGAGRDQFWSYPPEIDATGIIVRTVVEKLGELPRGQTVLALPEGAMINYLARRASPIPQFQLYGFTTEGGRESAVVKALGARPPDIIAFVGRDLRDFGIAVYGERDGAGREIMQWIAENYEVTHKIGSDPLDSARSGAYIMQKR